MINSKGDLKFFMECDRIALNKDYKKPKIIHDVIWKYEILLRKSEYYQNRGNKFISKIYKARLTILGHRLGFSIGLNTCGPGLAIVHYGLTVIHQNAHIGNNCRIHEGVTVGSNASSKFAPEIGDNVYIASGAKIIGDIKIANDVCIGANAVVVKDILEEGITVAGVPAKKINDKGSARYLVKATELVKGVNGNE
ncbi:serine O-acetyltransferase [Thomasclavelia sp.]